MSTRTGVLEASYEMRLRAWLAAVVLLVVLAAVAIGAARLAQTSVQTRPVQPERIESAFAGPVPDVRGPHGPNQTPKETPTLDVEIRPHGPNQVPKQ